MNGYPSGGTTVARPRSGVYPATSFHLRAQPASTVPTVLIVAVLSAAAGIVAWNTSFSSTVCINLLFAIQLALLVVHVITTHGLYRRYFDFQMILYFVLFLFNGGGITIKQFLSAYTSAPLIAFAPFNASVFLPFLEQDVIEAQVFICWVLGSLTVGLCLASHSSAATRPSQKETQNESQSMYRAGMFLSVLSAPFAVIALLGTFRAVRHGGYQALYSSGLTAESSYTQLASGLIPGVLYLLAARGKGRSSQILIFGGLFVHCAPIAMSGERVFAFHGVAAMVFLYHFRVRRIPPMMLVSVLAFAMILSTALFSARNAIKGKAVTADVLMQKLTDVYANMEYFLDETGRSMCTVFYTQMTVPSHRDFEWGYTAVRSCLATVPGILPPEESEFEGAWLTRVIAPLVFANHGGIGFSLIAEGFLNFGWYAPLFCVPLWYFVARASSEIHRDRGSPKIAYAAVCISFVLMGARGSTLTFMRKLLTLVVVPMFAIAIGDRNSPTKRNVLRRPQKRW